MRLFGDMLQCNDPAADAAYVELESSEQCAAARALAEFCSAPFAHDDIERFIGGLNRFQILPQHVSERVRAFAQAGNALGFLLLRHLPVDQVYGFKKDTCLSEALLLHMSLLGGEPFGYAGQRNGDVIQNIKPRPEDAHKLLGSGSAVELIWHTEDAHAELNCDLIALFCLRGDPGAITLVSQINPDDLDAADLHELERRQYVIRSDESYAGSITERETSVLAGSRGRLSVRYDPPFTRCETQAGTAALAHLTTHINARAIGVALATGDALLIDNRSAVHARTAFKARFDDTDRWIQRTAVFTAPVPARLRHPVRRCIVA